MLYECPFTCSVWRAISIWSGLVSFLPEHWSETSISIWSGLVSFLPEHWSETSTIADWFQQLAGPGADATAKGARSLAILVVWTIWSERNARIFKDEDRTADRLVQEIRDTARLWCTAGARHLATLVAQHFSE
ncbi:hypothetical protein HU200_059240 [Digitaria exilis]|uniref:Uncharacterized protein n=1 Tax=Digitaria exilis TaxID=1010633 RepID=A0A835AIP4_9POAL|nr:hypothetical protein HU200_059240 [Digitaria exilis]